MKNSLLNKISTIETPAFMYVKPFHLTQINQFLQKAKKQNKYTKVYYSVKTNDSTVVLEEIAKHVDGMEVISLRELALVKAIPQVNKIIVNGPCKTEQFLFEAVKCGAYIYIDNENEFYLLIKILKERKQSIEVGLRLMYGNGASDKKFGLSTRSSFYQGLLLDKESFHQYIDITGIHSHVSSYEESNEEFYNRISDMKKRADELETHGHFIKNINIGGGYEPVVRLNNLMEWEFLSDFDNKKATSQRVFLADADFITKKSLFMEPGRALSEAAILGVGEVVTIKSIKELTYVFINFSTAFAGGTHPAESCINLFVVEKNTGKLYPLTKNNQSKTMLCGPLCSGSDNFGLYSGRRFCVGDRIVLLNAGAYSLSFRWHGPEMLPKVTYFSEECT